MGRYSKGHEREEREKMGRGLWHSLFGILFCWLPLVGQALSISGFARQVVRLTDEYKGRLRLYMLIGVLSLILSTGALTGEIYLYTRDSNLPVKVGAFVWTKLTGQEEFPWGSVDDDSLGYAGTDYTGMDEMGLGVYDLTGADLSGIYDEDPENLPEGMDPDEAAPEDEYYTGEDEGGATYDDEGNPIMDGDGTVYDEFGNPVDPEATEAPAVDPDLLGALMDERKDPLSNLP